MGSLGVLREEVEVCDVWKTWLGVAGTGCCWRSLSCAASNIKFELGSLFVVCCSRVWLGYL